MAGSNAVASTVTITEFKKAKIFNIMEVDEQTTKIKGEFPIVAFGVKKAKAILNHIEDIKEFVKENE